MEKSPKPAEIISPAERNKLAQSIIERGDWFRPQFAAATQDFREAYIPLLSSLSVLESETMDNRQQAHVRKIIAIQAEVLQVIPDGVMNLDQVRTFAYEQAEAEMAEWQELDASKKRPQEWRNALFDSQKIIQANAKAESSE